MPNTTNAEELVINLNNNNHFFVEFTESSSGYISDLSFDVVDTAFRNGTVVIFQEASIGSAIISSWKYQNGQYYIGFVSRGVCYKMQLREATIGGKAEAVSVSSVNLFA